MVLRAQIIISFIVVLMISGMYFLPTVVVSNKTEDLETQETSQEQQKQVENSHQTNLSALQQKKLKDLKNSFLGSENTEKKITFADSIAVLFKTNRKLDSAAYYFAFGAEVNPSIENLLKAGNAYYEAFKFAVDANKTQKLGEITRNFYQKVLKKHQNNLDIKAKIAMTYTGMETMTGVKLLKEVLEQNAENELALFNLGILDIRSGQYPKAVQNFEKLLSVNPHHIDAKFYLGESYANINETTKAIQIFKEIAAIKGDSLAAYRAAANDYLKQLK